MSTKFLDSSGVQHLWNKAKDQFDTTQELTEITRILDTSILSNVNSDPFIYYYPIESASIDQEQPNNDILSILCNPFDTDLLTDEELDTLYENITQYYKKNFYIYKEEYSYYYLSIIIVFDNILQINLDINYGTDEEYVNNFYFTYNYNTKERNGHIYNKLQILLNNSYEIQMQG